MILFRPSGAVILSLLLPALALGDDPFTLYLAPDGDDERSGDTPAEAIQTFQRAHKILLDKQPDRDTVIRIAPGVYRGQRTIWTYSNPDRSITFTRRDPESDRPVFDACLHPREDPEDCPGGTWFRLRQEQGEPSNLVFSHLIVRNYGTVISFDGSRRNENGFNSDNRVTNCLFERIGTVSNPARRGSTAVIRMVNSRNNTVSGNEFLDIRNLDDRAGLLHALYLAHHSSDNTIDGNRFIDHTGDAVRVRDRSHRNHVFDNYFDRAGIRGAMSEWYPYPGVVGRPDRPTGECPSYGNQFYNNTVGTNYDGEPLAPIYLFHKNRPLPEGCPPPPEEDPGIIAGDNRTLESD